MENTWKPPTLQIIRWTQVSDEVTNDNVKSVRNSPSMLFQGITNGSLRSAKSRLSPDTCKKAVYRHTPPQNSNVSSRLGTLT